MIADCFHHRRGAGVSDREAFAGHAVEVSLSARCAVKNDVAHQNVFFRLEGRIPRGIDDELASRESFADVIVGFALQAQRDAFGQEGSETLPR